MATNPVSREIVRCLGCRLMQFKPVSCRCRRCRRPFEAPRRIEPEIVIPPPIERAEDFGSSLRAWREVRNMSQRKLALSLGISRMWISKLENGRSKPTLRSLERISKALQIDVRTLLDGGRLIEAEVFSDPLITELAPYVKHLNSHARFSIIELARELESGRKRSAA